MSKLDLEAIRARYKTPPLGTPGWSGNSRMLAALDDIPALVAEVDALWAKVDRLKWALRVQREHLRSMHVSEMGTFADVSISRSHLELWCKEIRSALGEKKDENTS